MRRALVMPVSAAIVGALLAVGVTALDRPHNAHESVHVVRVAPDVRVVRGDVAEEIEAEIEKEIAEAFEVQASLRGGLLEKVLREVESELRIAMESEDLTPREREKLQKAMERLDERLPMDLELAELIEGITKEDGSAHKDAVAADAPVAPAVPDTPETPAPPAGSSGN
jgi:hypothetical protein